MNVFRFNYIQLKIQSKSAVVEICQEILILDKKFGCWKIIALNMELTSHKLVDEFVYHLDIFCSSVIRRGYLRFTINYGATLFDKIVSFFHQHNHILVLNNRDKIQNSLFFVVSTTWDVIQMFCKKFEQGWLLIKSSFPVASTTPTSI